MKGSACLPFGPAAPTRTAPLSARQLELADSGEFPKKNVGFGSLKARHFAEGGSRTVGVCIGSKRNAIH
jgi:hypothetical protein